MKTLHDHLPQSLRTTIIKALCALAVAGAMALAPLQATDGTWLSGSGSGDWSDSGKWQSGDIASGVGSLLTIQAPDSSGSHTINLDSNRTIGNVTLGAGDWDSRMMTVSGNNTLTLQVSSGVPTITGPGGGGVRFGVEVDEVAGNQNLIIAGNNITHWNPGTMSLTGYIWIQSSQMLISRGEVFGNPATNEIYISGSGNIWVDPAGDITVPNDLHLGLDGAQSGGFTWWQANAGSVTVSGSIYQSNLSLASNFYYWSGTAGGQQRYIVTGDNNYRGETQIGPSSSAVLVLAQSDTAFGTGEAGDVILFTQAGGVGLSGGVTISNNRIVLNGPGFSGVGYDGVQWTGGLFNQDGDNTWGGEVALGSTANPRIGAAEDTHFTVSGVITGSASGGLTTAGDGTIEFTQANTYSTGTTIASGILIASNNQALGTGALAVQTDGTLEITQGINLGVTNITLDGDAELTFNLTDAPAGTMLTASGDQIGSGIYTVNIADAGGFTFGTYTLMTINGTFEATGFQLGEFVPGFVGLLNWDGGVLSLQVIPEPATTMLLLFGMVLAARRVVRRRRL